MLLYSQVSYFLLFFFSSSLCIYYYISNFNSTLIFTIYEINLPINQNDFFFLSLSVCCSFMCVFFHPAPTPPHHLALSRWFLFFYSLSFISSYVNNIKKSFLYIFSSFELVFYLFLTAKIILALLESFTWLRLQTIVNVITPLAKVTQC